MGKPPEGGKLLLAIFLIINFVKGQNDYECPPQEKILPCRCSTRDMEYQIWCSHSELPKVLEGLNSISHYITHPIDELILENNNLPSLPGKVFTSLRVLRLMLRNNRLERVSSGWLDGLHDSLLELFLVEPDLRSLPIDSLDNLQGLEAITLQSKTMKRLPRFSGLTKLRYLQINSPSLIELSPMSFKDLPNLEQLHVFGSLNLVRLEAGLFRNLPKLSMINITDCGITWLHPRTFIELPELQEISLKGNSIQDAAIIGRAIIDLPRLSIIHLDYNKITKLQEECFVDLLSLSRLSLSNNYISEILPGSFQHLPLLRVLNLNNNKIIRIHPNFFIQRLGSNIEELLIINNNINHINEIRSIFEALPKLKLLDLSYNFIEEIPFGSLRGHLNLERLHIDHNQLTYIQRETFTSMPLLRELRLKNNSLTNSIELPFWNLPNLKGLDLSQNYFRHIDSMVIANLPNLRILDLSGNGISHIEPETFYLTPELENLNLSGNALSSIHPMTMRQLKKLYELDVSWNRLLNIIPGLPKNIEHLHLSMNRIIQLPTIQSQDLSLPSLRTLDISANGIELILPGTFSELPNLKKLNIGYNSIRLIDDNIFDGLVRLEILDLRYNRIVTLHGRSLKPLRSLLDLSLRGNRIEIIRSDIFDDNILLKRLDLAINNLAQIPHSTFLNTRNLRELYASHNTLTELPGSLHGLSSLEVLDLSFNKLNILSPDTLSSLTSLLELKLVRNKIKELREGAFSRLPRLNFIDLENNDLRVIEKNSIKNLPELQAIKLGKNKIQTIPSGAFVDLPLLQSTELQENRIQEISANAFVNVPHILFLNLSHNLLPSIEHAGLTGLRSLEVLDVSSNRLTRISTDSFALMEWLVELKMDNNRICGIEGAPFNDMPRLRVLSMRSNRMNSVSENAFKRLRSNIAILDIDGWLQQGSTEGPKCADGTLFKEMRLSRQDCLKKKYTTNVHPGCEAEMINQAHELSSYNDNEKLPPAWMNIQKPTKFSNNQDDYLYEDYPEYHYTNTTDQSTSEEINLSTSAYPTNIIITDKPQIVNDKPQKNSNTAIINDKNNLPPVKKKKPSNISASPGSSGFTFFGVPLPNLNFNLWGNTGKKKGLRKNDEKSLDNIKYRTFPKTEPEIHRGGFYPLPQPEGGFQPVTDPRLIYETKFKNHTINNNTITAKILRITNATKINNKNIQDDFIIKKNNITSKGDIQRVQLNNNKTKFINLTIPNVKKNITTTTTEIYDDNDENNNNYDIDSDESMHLEGKIASKIVWTTPLSSSSAESLLLDTSTEGNYRSRKKSNNLFDNDDHTSLVKPDDLTTPMSTIEPVVYVTTNKENNEIQETTASTSSTTTKPTTTTTMMNHNEHIFTNQTSQGMEASALSALLIPGGQIPVTVPIIGKIPGRSTIEKVASPRMANNTNKINNKNADNDDDKTTVNNDKTIEDDDPFNWYFQNYNDSNLEPYIGAVDNGQISTNKSNIIFILLISILLNFI
ncbi:hypothetical protein HCN44_000568 [Aphidius gifuensis]|uniref:Chaoptin n=1 Tax=Aphidius gifuensis TaxID=684658 RepID=A0A834XNX0_APHGI|nr:hypothetical protein HCN44_000568 [Aphidius gifuensis]